MRDDTFTPLIAELSKVPALGELPEAYERIRERLRERLSSSRPLYPMVRDVLEQLLRQLPAARGAALDLANRFQSIAALAQRYFDDMDFRFLFDENRQLLRIGYNVDAGRGDASYYDLLASEARTTVFLAIAKGDIPRESWLRLGRKLTAYRDQVTLLAWSGTMFEYLMPQLYLRSYAGTLLDRALRAAIRIQQAYGQERGVPWGISEAAHSERDERGQYQYYAFGVPPLSASGDEADAAGDCALRHHAGSDAGSCARHANLRAMAAKGWWTRHGFFESIDYSRAERARRSRGGPLFHGASPGDGAAGDRQRAVREPDAGTVSSRPAGAIHRVSAGRADACTGGRQACARSGLALRAFFFSGCFLIALAEALCRAVR